MAKPSTSRSAPRKRKAAELVVSLDEFASICGVTPETMRKHLAQAPANSAWLIERGRRGVGYKIAAGGAVSWWKARSAGGDGDDIRSAAMAELRMSMLGDTGDDEGLLLTGKQRFEEYKAGEAELTYRQSIGELARVAEIENETVNAVIELRRKLLGVGRAIRIKHKLPREVEDAIDGLIAERLKLFVEKLDVDVDAEHEPEIVDGID